MQIKLLSIAIIGLLNACGAGSGSGLSNQGLPVQNENNTGNEPEESGITLAQLQETIFSPRCSACHSGSAAPLGLRLDSEENSFAFLVDRTSGERPSLMRVNPGNADESYLVNKLEGATSIVGARMPLGGPFLTTDQINDVRDWIANGAPRTGTGISSTKISAINVQQTTAGLDADLRFSRSVQFPTITDGAVDVFYATTPSLPAIGIEEFGMLLMDQTLHITIPQLPAEATQIEIVIKDTMPYAVLDVDNRQVDGNNDENEGGAYRHVYTLSN